MKSNSCRYPSIATGAEATSLGRNSSLTARGSTNWKMIAGIATVVAVAAFAVWSISGTLSNPTANTNYIDAVDASDVSNPVPLPKFYAPAGATAPYKSPTTGKNAVWPAERCYWTKDGKGKTVPTLVLLNSLVGKPGDTICPDCGRKIYPRFPMPPDKVMIEAVQEGR